MVKSRFESKEGKCCDAILRVLEREFGAVRADLRFPEREHDSAPVELTCTIGATLVALEHTRLEAYPMQMQDGVRFAGALERLEKDLDQLLPRNSFFMLSVPSNAFDGRSANEAQAIGDRIRDWVLAVASAMSATSRFDGRRADIPGVPFTVALDRANGMPWEEGRLLIARFMPSELEAKRAARVKTALDGKLPKLAAWKDRGAATVLVLENDDIALSNVALIAAAVQAADPAPALLPDRIYEIDTPGSPWTVWTLRRAPGPIALDGPPEWSDLDPTSLQDVLA
jgi:hypothetical protein